MTRRLTGFHAHRLSFGHGSRASPLTDRDHGDDLCDVWGEDDIAQQEADKALDLYWAEEEARAQVEEDWDLADIDDRYRHGSQ